MAHSLSAKKRVRQNASRRGRNRARKDQIRIQTKSFLSALAEGDLEKAEQELRQAERRIDQVAARGTIHKNAAARKRSRLTKRLNDARAGVKGTVAATA